MLDDQVHHALAIACFDSGNHLVVVLERLQVSLLHLLVSRTIEGLADARMIDQQAIVARTKIGIVGHFAHQRMKALVPVNQVLAGARLDRLPESCLHLAHFLDLGRPGVLRGEPRDRRIQHRGGNKEIS